MKSPILFLVFNRPETTRRVFQAIREYKPSKLYVAADGPRKSRKDDYIRCREVKNIVSKIDWNCEVKTLFREKNLGCRMAVNEAIDWFFYNVESGIILEDDCLPDCTFFKYCEVMLSHYKNDKQIMHVGGNNFQKNKSENQFGYYFSKYPHIWGWATWRRSWKKYVRFESFITNNHFPGLSFSYINIFEKIYWVSLFWCVKHKLIDTWDFQWVYSIWANDGICITPNNNLVINIGIGSDSTNTKTAGSTITELKLEEFTGTSFYKNIKTNFYNDQFTLKTVFSVKAENMFRILSIVPYYLFRNIVSSK